MENGGVVCHAVALVVESSGCVGIWRAGRSESQEHALQRPPRVTLRFTILRGRIYIVVPGCKSYARITTEVAPFP